MNAPEPAVLGSPSAALPPGPAAPAILQTLKWAKRPKEFLRDCERRFGHCFTLRFVEDRAFVVVRRPEDVRAVFAGSGEAFMAGRAQRTNILPMGGSQSVMVLDGEAHNQARQLLRPLFNNQRMLRFGETMRALALDAFDRIPTGATFSLLDLMHQVTLRVIGRTIFGLADPALEQELVQIVDLLRRRMSPSLVFLTGLQVDLGRITPWGRFQRARRRLDDFIHRQIDIARSSDDARDDVLAVLSRASDADGARLSREQIRDQVVTLLWAGHDTSATSLAWALQWVLGTPAVRERAMAEVRAHAAGGTEDVAQLSQLRYIDACVNETLRMSPPTLISLRYLARDAELAGRSLPAGTIVAPCAYLAHRDMESYEDPDRFWPDRFLAGNPGPDRFFPFGGGVRRCLGAGFATFEMKVILASLLARGTIELARPAEDRSRRKGFVVAPEGGVRARIVARHAGR